MVQGGEKNLARGTNKRRGKESMTTQIILTSKEA